MFTVVLGSSKAIRKQLNEGLSLIAASDFPLKWPALLPELVQSLSTPARGTQAAALDAMASIFEPFRKSTIEESNDTLEFCQETAAAAVLQTVEAAGEAVQAAAGKREVLQELCSVVRLGNEIVFSLNVFGLSITMAKMAERWMKVWKTWLEFHDESLKEADSDVESAECGICVLCQMPCLELSPHE